MANTSSTYKTPFISLPGFKMQQATRSLRTIRPGFFRRQLNPIKSRSVWTPGPSPPRLPKEEQEMFEKLQQQSTGAFSTPRQLDSATDSTASNTDSSKSTNVDQMLEQLREKARVVAKGDGEELHPHVRRGAKPEFEGDVNPKTGEVGGPKNEPVRWGPSGDWSYNGRVSDF